MIRFEFLKDLSSYSVEIGGMEVRAGRLIGRLVQQARHVRMAAQGRVVIVELRKVVT